MIRMFVGLVLLAGSTFAEPVSEEEAREILAKGEIIRTEVVLHREDLGWRYVEYEIRHKGEFHVCIIFWKNREPTEEYTFYSWTKTGQGCSK